MKRTHFEGLGTKLLLTTFCDLLTRHLKKRKKSHFLKCEKDVEYILSNNVRGWLQKRTVVSAEKTTLPREIISLAPLEILVATVSRLLLRAHARGVTIIFGPTGNVMKLSTMMTSLYDQNHRIRNKFRNYK